MQLNQCLTGNLEIIGDCLSFVYNLVMGNHIETELAENLIKSRQNLKKCL
jgi:hypothetical protein